MFANNDEREDFYVVMNRRNQQDWVPIVRVQSSCIASELFQSTDCDCADQLQLAVQRICMQGGIVIYLRQEGRGHGLYKKIQAMHLSDSETLDTVQAYERLGLEQDVRDYSLAAAILGELGVRRIVLLTNNCRKTVSLRGCGVDVIEVRSHESRPTIANRNYLLVKKLKLGHTISIDDTANGTA
jgi:3,4-dihydroxy 2-butanone 4-phosphate synthase/GTP cyclohydrolase II